MTITLQTQQRGFGSCSFVRIFFYIFLFGTCSSSGDQLKYEDLAELIKKKNGAVHASDEANQAYESRLGHYTRSFLPHLSVFGGAEQFRMGPTPTELQPYGGVELSLNIFRGGQDLIEEQYRQANFLGGKAERETVFRKELSFVRSHYWELVFQREWIATLEQFLKQSEKGARAASRRKARGLIPDTDLLAFDLYTQYLKEEIESAVHEIELIQVAMRPRLELGEKASLETPFTIPHDHDEVLLAAPPNSHPEVESLTAKSEAQALLAKQSGRWWLPMVDAYGDYSLYTLRERSYPDIRDRYDLAFGVKLRMQLFDGFQSNHETDSGYQSAHASEVLANYRKKTLASDIRLAQEEMKHIHELIHGAESFLEKGKKLLSQSLSEYDRGVRTTQDVLSVTDRMLSFQKMYLERRRNYQKTKVKLLSLLGK